MPKKLKPFYFDKRDEKKLTPLERELLAALKLASALINIARSYFPKSPHNTGKALLENTAVAINSAIAKVEGR